PRPTRRSSGTAMRTLRSAAIWGGIGAVTVLVFLGATITALLAYPWDYRRRRIACLFPRWWAMSVVRVNPLWSAHVDDRKLPRGRHFVVVSNHQSLGDIITNLQLRHHFKFISKSSVFAVPCLGWFM